MPTENVADVREGVRMGERGVVMGWRMWLPLPPIEVFLWVCVGAMRVLVLEKEEDGRGEVVVDILMLCVESELIEVMGSKFI